MAKDEGRENPKPTAYQRRKARMERIRSAALSGDASLQTPVRFTVGGRRRALDPDQDTLDKNVKTILGAGSMNCSIEETAALHEVSMPTLMEFFKRYPEIRDRFDDAKLTGKASVKRNQFKLSETSPQMAIFLGEQHLGQLDPHKLLSLELEREKFKEHIRLEEEKLALRERDVAAKERLLNMRQPADFGSGLPIDVKSLSLPQLMQLAARLREAMEMGNGLTIDAVVAEPDRPREPEKTG